jgi:hypothetical protein
MSVILKHRQFGDSMYLWKRWVKMSQVPLHHGLDFPSGRRGEGRDALCQVWTTRRRCPPALAWTDAPWATADSVAHCAVFFCDEVYNFETGKKTEPWYMIWMHSINQTTFSNIPWPAKTWKKGECNAVEDPFLQCFVKILIVYVYLYL